MERNTIHELLLGPDSTKNNVVELSCLLGILSANDTLPSLDTNPAAVDVEIAKVVVKRAAYSLVSVRFQTRDIARNTLGGRGIVEPPEDLLTCCRQHIA